MTWFTKHMNLVAASFFGALGIACISFEQHWHTVVVMFVFAIHHYLHYVGNRMFTESLDREDTLLKLIEMQAKALRKARMESKS